VARHLAARGIPLLRHRSRHRLGGAWNASIVSEAVNWGPTKIDGSGLGAYIARMTEAGDYPRIALGVAIMSILVVAMNGLVWRPLYAFAERRTRLD
jgi:NitT/TauT family transport system permease protein